MTTAAAPPRALTRAATLGPRARLFLTSFVILFFELVCIRWIPSYVRYLSYFSNFILLGAFLGIGTGCLMARRKGTLLTWFPLALLSLVLVVGTFKFDLVITSERSLYFQAPNAQGKGGVESYLLLPLVFLLVSGLFLLLSQELGRLLSALPPLTAYSVDIAGSLAGIAAFAAMSFLQLPPAIWFFLLAIALLPLLASVQPSPGVRLGNLALLTLIVGYVNWLALREHSSWSPYYRIRLLSLPEEHWALTVNGIGHQDMAPNAAKVEEQPFYGFVWEAFAGQRFPDVMIIGAGSGSDTALALDHGVQSVDAVEIDPRIYALGAQYNPNHPYQDPRVHRVIDDGRAFMRRTDKRYDLIIFALPDSLTLTSSFANLRLESYLFTAESMADARDHLKPNGLLVLYNYYRQDWLVRKLANMLQETFHQQPLVRTWGGFGRAAVLMVGPRLAQARTDPRWESYQPGAMPPPATDDWPFPYLQAPGIPAIYLQSLGLVALIGLGYVWRFGPPGALRHLDPHFFFLGAAFMLLEVKSIVSFSLLFGSTWFVNSLVFFAVLCMVLLANLVNARFTLRDTRPYYALLLGLLLFDYLLPPEDLLLPNAVLRYVVASVLVFLPIFLANVIFSNAFRDSSAADLSFASNLLGAFFGGMFEYLSLLTGYRRLFLLVMAFYALAWAARRFHLRVPALHPSPA